MGRNSWYTGSWSGVDCTCDILDKSCSIFNYVMLMFDRTNQMFEYEGLPETIPTYMLELYLQLNGHVCVTKVNGNLYALPGGLGGAPDPYYRPTLYVVANPGLGYSASLRIVNHLPPFGEQADQGECVLMRNDTNVRGLFYLCSRYATQLAENDVSIRSAQINSRQQTLIVGNTDKQIASANAYYDNLEKGKIVAVGDKEFLEGVTVANVSVQGANSIIQLIELQQYLKASWFNEIGLNANFNMKREYLSEEELRASTDVLLPLIDDMLRCREDAISVINSTYGTNITVKKNSAWENKQEELDTEQDQKEADVEATLGSIEGKEPEKKEEPEEPEEKVGDEDE